MRSCMICWMQSSHTVIPSQLHRPQTTQYQGRRQKVAQDLQAKEKQVYVMLDICIIMYIFVKNNSSTPKSTSYETD